MDKKKSKSAYQHMVHVTNKHFGKDAPPHLVKLIQTHLGKPAEEVTHEELTSLIDWIKSAVSFLDEDRVKVEKYLDELFKGDGSVNSRVKEIA